MHRLLLPCFSSTQTECIPLPSLLQLALSCPCYPCPALSPRSPMRLLFPHPAARLTTAAETAHPLSAVSGTAASSQHSSASSASSGLEAFTCSTMGNVLSPSLSVPILHTATVALPKFQIYGSFLPGFCFCFSERASDISSKKASLFNLNTLRQSEGNRPHRPSAAWQVSMSQGE